MLFETDLCSKKQHPEQQRTLITAQEPVNYNELKMLLKCTLEHKKYLIKLTSKISAFFYISQGTVCVSQQRRLNTVWTAALLNNHASWSAFSDIPPSGLLFVSIEKK